MAHAKARLGLKSLTVVAGLAIASGGGYGGVLFYSGNFHAVSDGVVYRSAQLSKGRFEAAIRDYKLKSILNLRGAHPGESWYDDETAASRQAGVHHYDYALSATRRVNDDQIREILRLIGNAPKPLLLHCLSGADRSGLVAALFRYAIEHASAADADRQLSVAYGHFPYLTSRTGAMDESFWAFVDHSSRVLAKR
jgi:protein tyrosine/serine phosphatase